eukprot:1150255-Pelagomonas_calceolata.AAC.1
MLDLILLGCMHGLKQVQPVTHCVRSGQPIAMREFVVDLRKRLWGVWNADALAEHVEHTNKGKHLIAIAVTKEDSKKQTNETYCSISDLMDIVCAIGTVEQAEQPNYLAEDHFQIHATLVTPFNPSKSMDTSGVASVQDASDFLLQHNNKLF